MSTLPSCYITVLSPKCNKCVTVLPFVIERVNRVYIDCIFDKIYLIVYLFSKKYFFQCGVVKKRSFIRVYKVYSLNRTSTCLFKVYILTFFSV